MALATRCPHCQTAFRVASDQLKLRAGLVRCGTCKEIFNGIENLLHPDEEIGPAPSAGLTDATAPTGPTTTADTAEPDTANTAESAPVATPVTAAEGGPAAVPDSDSARLWEALDAFSIAPDADAAPTADAATPAAHDHPPRPGEGDGDASQDANPVHAGLDTDDTDDVDGDDDANGNADVDVGLDADTDTDTDTDMNADASRSDQDNDHIVEPVPHGHRASAFDEAADAPALPHLLRTAAVADDGAPTARPAVPAPAVKPRKQPKPPVAALDEAENEDAQADRPPDFVIREEEREVRHRTRRPLMIAGSALLALTLLAQGVYTTRTALAAAVPALRPMLDQACRLVGCTVGLPMQIESVSIESSDFQPYPDHPDQFLLSVLLRNRSSTVQAWPTIELTLNDATDKAVGRRLIGPRDYLPPGQANARGFSAGSEQALRLVFDLSRLKASGYRVYLFYP